MTTAIKSTSQPFQPSSEIQKLMETFRIMVNECIMIGLEHNVSTRMKLSSLAYQRLAFYDVISYYKLCAISHAAGILANRKKSIRRGLRPRQPYAARPFLVSCYGFKIVDGMLDIPLGNRKHRNIPLNSYVKAALFSSYPLVRIRSFTLALDRLTLCYSREVQRIECKNVVGLDRNLSNVTVGNKHSTTQYDLSKAIDISENTRSIMRSVKRNDVRVRRRLYRKYGARRKGRVNQLLHRATKAIVQRAKQDKSALAFEDIRHIRSMYQKGNYQGRIFRGRMNGWSFSELKRQIEYKANWEGLPVIQLSKSETRGTSQLCPQCGKKITQVDRFRQLYCAQCKKWMDRDVVAAMNISIKGLQRFCSSKGLADEAMVQEAGSKEPVILRVDASKLASGLKSQKTGRTK